ncbi:MAG: hypothetical protein U0871_11840 [Gemmataceae bacterium]
MTHLGLLALGLIAAQSKADAAKLFPPDPATMKKIVAKTAELRAAVAGLPEKTPDDIRADVEVYLKAAEWVVRHGEWFAKDSGQQALRVLDAGLTRATAAKGGKAPWRDVRGRPVVRGYRSSVDGSVQPYSVTIPPGFPDPANPRRLDTVLHGRDQTLTEVKFIAAREAARPRQTLGDAIVLEPYGRGNNAYRWAGETDVFEAASDFTSGMLNALDPKQYQDSDRLPISPFRHVLRGFSMGGAGTWHIGLHRPSGFAVIGPGAGFTTTRGYVGNLPAKLPDYVERCLHIYDAVDYAENAFDVPVVAYSGEKDKQKAAADNIERALKDFPEPVRFTHLVAPGLEHKMPPEWEAKAEAEYARYAGPGKGRSRVPQRVRFVTYTTRYSQCDWVSVLGLDRHYDKAVIDARLDGDLIRVDTRNVRLFRVGDPDEQVKAVVIDGQRLDGRPGVQVYEKRDGKWGVRPPGAEFRVVVRGGDRFRFEDRMKRPGLQGPIDDAFMGRFTVVPPAGDGWHPSAAKLAADRLASFGREWDRYFRGTLPTTANPSLVTGGHQVLFGDPGNNPTLAKVVEKLPITWTRDKLVVNGVEYEPATHLPVLIYPDPLNPARYVVINSGHTFGEADLKGTNALLYPRLGDWAVLEAGTGKVVAAGLFDESWRFEKK